MKKYLFTLIALFCLQMVYTQTENYLIYREYDPNYWIELKFDSPFGVEFYYINVDDDGNPDVAYSIWGEDHWTVSQMGSINGWEACNYRLQSKINNFYHNLSTPLNDTSLIWGFVILPETNSFPDTIKYKTALRYQIGEDYYYGWAEFEEIIASNSPVYPRFYFRIVRTCFCAIPNYPLVWGQTSLTDGVEEKAENNFACLYPNPTNGQVTITGQDLKAAEVFNAIGQRVATATGGGERLTVDLSGLPAGIYFVNVTDEEGQNCVRKVLKQ